MLIGRDLLVWLVERAKGHCLSNKAMPLGSNMQACVNGLVSAYVSEYKQWSGGPCRLVLSEKCINCVPQRIHCCQIIPLCVCVCVCVCVCGVCVRSVCVRERLMMVQAFQRPCGEDGL